MHVSISSNPQKFHNKCKCDHTHVFGPNTGGREGRSATGRADRTGHPVSMHIATHRHTHKEKKKSFRKIIRISHSSPACLLIPYGSAILSSLSVLSDELSPLPGILLPNQSVNSFSAQPKHFVEGKSMLSVTQGYTLRSSLRNCGILGQQQPLCLPSLHTFQTFHILQRYKVNELRRELSSTC